MLQKACHYMMAATCISSICLSVCLPESLHCLGNETNGGSAILDPSFSVPAIQHCAEQVARKSCDMSQCSMTLQADPLTSLQVLDKTAETR